jgi:SAM-dependent methyltransferase
VRPPSDAAGLSRLAPTVARFARAGLFHYGRLLGNGYRVLREVESALAAEADERVLDVGCGTGGNCVAVPGDYVGIDLDPDYVAFARLVVVDAEPEASNRLQSFLLRHDRGAFIRPRAAQRRLLAACFAVVAEGQFRNTPHTVVQTLFVCEPKV